MWPGRYRLWPVLEMVMLKISPSTSPSSLFLNPKSVERDADGLRVLADQRRPKMKELEADLKEAEQIVGLLLP